MKTDTYVYNYPNALRSLAEGTLSVLPSVKMPRPMNEQAPAGGGKASQTRGFRQTGI